jgi:hypothetical protein
MIVTTSCALCGPVELSTEVDLFEPQTDDEYATAWEIARTLHEIQSHLDDVGPECAA